MVSAAGFGTITKFLGPLIQLITLDASARMVQSTLGRPELAGKIPPIAKSAITLGITLARFPIINNMLDKQKLPMGLGPLVKGIMGLSAVQIVIQEIPNLLDFSGFGNIGGGGGDSAGELPFGG
jgi:hypothetical protein